MRSLKEDKLISGMESAGSQFSADMADTNPRRYADPRRIGAYLKYLASVRRGLDDYLLAELTELKAGQAEKRQLPLGELLLYAADDPRSYATDTSHTTNTDW